MDTAWTSTPSYGLRQCVRNLLIRLDKICQPTRSDRRRYEYGYERGFATADREPRRSTTAGALRGEVAPRCTYGSVIKGVTTSMRVKLVRCCSPSLYRVHAVDA